MPEWTAKLTVVNNTNQDLELVRKFIYEDNLVSSFPHTIPAKKRGVYRVFTPPRKPLGPEFKILLVAQGKKGEESLGSFYFHIDIPFWKKKNTLEYHDKGDLICRVSPLRIDTKHNAYDGEVIITAISERTQKNKEVVSEAGVK